jgi:hypothetical protein
MTSKQGRAWWERRRIRRKTKQTQKLPKDKMGPKLALMPLYNPLDLRLEEMGTFKTLFAFLFPQIKALAFQTHVSFFF